MEVWAGEVALSSHQQLQGIRLYSQDTSASSTQARDVKLSYLAIVNPRQVPLHLIAGPPFQVYTDNKDSEAWLGETLLHDYSINNGEASDAPATSSLLERVSEGIGVLLKVVGLLTTPTTFHGITELLLYASSASTASCHPKSLPRSSSPVSNTSSSVSARLYALPISTDFRLSSLQSLPTSPTLAPRFLAHPKNQSPPSLKRRRLSSLFDVATRNTKRGKHRRVESVTAAIRTVRQSSALSVQPLDASRPISKFSRAHTTGSLRVSCQPTRPNDRSESGYPPAISGTSSLCQSISSLDRRDPALPSSVMIADGTAENANKSSLARVVLAGMRLYGLVQRRRGQAGEVEELDDDQTSKDSDFKAIYHQTYKAAAFTLRREMALVVLAQEKMRPTVNRLLEIFCTEPGNGGHWVAGGEL